MKKTWIAFLLAALLCMAAVSASATVVWDGALTADQVDLNKLTETTIYQDADSITGYTAAFRFYAPEAARVRVAGEWAFNDMYHSSLATMNDVVMMPDQWVKGAFPSLATATPIEMELNKDTGYWSCEIPLPSGTFNYQFWLGGEEAGNKGAEITADPQNRPIEMAEGNEKMSQIFMPFDAEKQIDDYSVQAPRTDGKVGEVRFETYTSTVLGGTTCKLGIYLPYGYDANREEPYKVLYLSHGGAGIESGWLSQGATSHIADNLIADGVVEPMIIVTPNMRNAEDTGFAHYTVNVPRLIEDVIPYIEANYNVSKKVEDRALAGLSMGGILTFHAFYLEPTAFGHYASWSSGVGAGMNNVDDLMANYDLSADVYKNVSFSTGCGTFASETLAVEAMQKLLYNNGIDFTTCYVNGNHRWHVWRVELTDLLTRILWNK